MFLAIDVGNTQTTMGLFEKNAPLRADPLVHWRMATDCTDTVDELHARVNSYLHIHDMTPEVIEETALASVVPVLTSTWRELLSRFTGTRFCILSADTIRGLTITVHASHIGADRIANALEAKECYGAPVIVVDFGTATNIDVVDETHTFRGGTIAPGLLLSARTLFARAAQLASVAIEVPEHTLGSTTESAMQSGIVIGEAARAEGLVRRIQAELHAPSCPVIATGGFASIIANATNIFQAVDDTLTLRGIRRAAASHCAPDRTQ